MKFKMPTSCRIGGTTYQVVHEGLMDHALYGQTVYAKELIKVDPAYSPDVQRRTFLHEALHAIEEVYDCNLKESQVRRLAHGLDELVQQLEVDDAISQG